MASPDPALDFDALRYESLLDRPSKVRLANLGRPSNGPGSLEEFLDGLPSVLAAQSLKQLADAIATAHSASRQVVAAWVVT